jgi:hypothetical protein
MIKNTYTVIKRERETHLRLLTPEEIKTYKERFRTKQQLNEEIEKVRHYLIICEQPEFYEEISREEHQMAVAKSTQLFKALLEVKQTIKS